MPAEILVEAMKFAVEWSESQARDRQIEKIASGLSDLSSKLDLVQRQMAQLLLREVRAAFDALQDAKRSSNAGTATARLRFAEESFLKNTRLDPSLTFGSLATTAIMAMCHQGLAIICALREDHELAEKHLLRLFIVNPRLARTELNPSLYDALFRPKCEDIYERYNRRDSDRRSRQEERANTKLDTLPGVPTTIRAMVVGLQLTSLVGGAVGDAFGANFDQILREDELDQRCRTIAAELLGIDLDKDERGVLA